MIETPVLLITFNRPNHARLVWDELKKQHPRHVYIFRDGPRDHVTGDYEKCKFVADLFDEKPDWPCEIKTFFSESNMGCGRGPSTAISWFFENVEEGIIIEDDAVPATDFLSYAQELLSIYRYNKNVRAIASMKIDDRIYGDSSYYFSMMNRNLCAWATWKRAWNDFDYYLDNVNVAQIIVSLKYYGVTHKEIEYWCERFAEIKKDRYGESSWDQQFFMSIWLNQGFGICPNVNLSTNIGFDEDGTHTRSHDSKAANVKAGSIMPLVHPSKIIINRRADLNYHKLYFQPWEYGWRGLKQIPFRLNKKLKKLVGHEGSWRKKNHIKDLVIFFKKTKSELKNNLLWHKHGLAVKKKILKYYSSLPISEIDSEKNEVISYLKKNPISLLPYDFRRKYFRSNIKVYFDASNRFKYTLHDNKRLYFKKNWSKNKIRKYYKHLLAEQDVDSPHRYLTSEFNIDDNSVIIDAGVAEGIFTLMNIDKISKGILFEPDQEWIEALKLTFKDYTDKIILVNKFLGEMSSENHATIDNYFQKNERIDFIKIDVEGYEMAVLKGASKLLGGNHGLKIVIACYHKCNDEIKLKKYLESYNFNCSYSYGYILFFYDSKIEEPFLRRGLIRACNQAPFLFI